MSRRLTIGPFNRVEGDLEVTLEIAGGRAFAVNVDAPDPDQHLGLDVHVDYQVVEPET